MFLTCTKIENLLFTQHFGEYCISDRVREYNCCFGMKPDQIEMVKNKGFNRNFAAFEFLVVEVKSLNGKHAWFSKSFACNNSEHVCVFLVLLYDDYEKHFASDISACTISFAPSSWGRFNWSSTLVWTKSKTFQLHNGMICARWEIMGLENSLFERMVDCHVKWQKGCCSMDSTDTKQQTAWSQPLAYEL